MILTEYDYDTDIAVQREEAYEEGIQQGIQQGITQGAEQTRIETAKKMLCDRLSVKSVSKYTGLPFETVDQLAKELKG